MKLIIILVIAFVIWLLQKFAENYKQQQENRPPMGTPRKPQPPPRQAAPPVADDDAWQDWTPAPQTMQEPELEAPSRPALAPAPVSPTISAGADDTPRLKAVGAPPPLFESEVAKADAKVEGEIAHDLASSLTAESATAATAATAGVMKTSLDAAFLRAARQARQQLRPGQPRIRIQTRHPALLRQSLVMTEVLGRPRAFDV